MQSSRLVIDLPTIKSNLEKFINKSQSVMVMVKANGYGTDKIDLANFIQRLNHPAIPFLGVSHVSEGIHLREAGIKLPIFVISMAPWEAEYTAAYALTPAINTGEELEVLNRQCQKQQKKIAIHLHLDTGMNRSGSSPLEAKKLYKELTQSSHLIFEGLWTHFAAAESVDFDRFTYEQIKKFKDFLDFLPQKPKWIHAANSAGAVRFHLPFCNLSRIGLGYFGLGPNLPDIKNALSLKTKLAAIKYVSKDECVGYYCLHRVEKDRTPIGIIPFGYGDGLPRSISKKSHVLICGKKAPIIGIICMDFTMVDLTQIPEAVIGDEVILFDESLSPETVASWAGTDVREILVRLSKRIERQWNNNGHTNTKKFPNAFRTIEKNTASR